MSQCKIELFEEIGDCPKEWANSSLIETNEWFDCTVFNNYYWGWENWLLIIVNWWQLIEERKRKRRIILNDGIYRIFVIHSVFIPFICSRQHFLLIKYYLLLLIRSTIWIGGYYRLLLSLLFIFIFDLSNFPSLDSIQKSKRWSCAL